MSRPSERIRQPKGCADAFFRVFIFILSRAYAREHPALEALGIGCVVRTRYPGKGRRRCFNQHKGRTRPLAHTLEAALGAVVFMVLDGLWLGVLMKRFYRDQLAPIARLADGGIAPDWPAAFLVYALLGTGIALFVMPRASTVPLAAVRMMAR